MSNEELKHYGVKGMKWRKHKTKAKQALDEYHDAERSENMSRYHYNQNIDSMLSRDKEIAELRSQPLTSGTQAELIQMLKYNKRLSNESSTIWGNIQEEERRKKSCS